MSDHNTKARESVESAITEYRGVPSQPSVNVDPTTGEILAPAVDAMRSLKDNPYVGVAACPVTPEQAELLMQEIPIADIEIRPDGFLYYPEIKYRRILNKAFGPGAWAMIPLDITVSPKDEQMYYRGALFVGGRFVAESIGEPRYFPSNDNMSYATAAESAKSNCLMRCCKDIGIASELWDREYTESWKAKHAVEVWCINIGSNDRGRKKKMWRKRSAPPIEMYPWKEEGANVEQRTPVRSQRDDEYQNFADRNEAPPGFPVSRPEPGPHSDNRNVSIISIKQAGRMRAIAKSHGWTDPEFTYLLGKFNAKNSQQVNRADYDLICDTLLVDPATMDEARKAVAAREEYSNNGKSDLEYITGEE